MSDTTFQALFDEVQKLSPSEQLRMMELLAATLQREIAPRGDWHSALRATYGILADDPIERPPQLEIEEREAIE